MSKNCKQKPAPPPAARERGAADRSRCRAPCRRWACRPRIPARLLAEAAAADPQRLPRIRVADRSPKTSPAWPARKPRCRASSRTTARAMRWTAAPRAVRRGRCSPACRDHDWTLLVQDVDKWDADVAALLDSFDFLPRWRIDDVMVSFAAPGGSVGAHVDQYDVFLLQAQGRRRWQIDACARTRRPDSATTSNSSCCASSTRRTNGCWPGRHALPAARRAAPRRRRRRLPDLLHRHARPGRGRTARRLRRHPGSRCRRGLRYRDPDLAPGHGSRTRSTLRP